MYFNAEEFGKRMQKVRCENHLTQEQLADLLNISRIHVARIERGARTCSIDLLVEIADALHCADSCDEHARVSPAENRRYRHHTSCSRRHDPRRAQCRSGYFASGFQEKR